MEVNKISLLLLIAILVSVNYAEQITFDNLSFNLGDNLTKLDNGINITKIDQNNILYSNYTTHTYLLHFENETGYNRTFNVSVSDIISSKNTVFDVYLQPVISFQDTNITDEFGNTILIRDVGLGNITNNINLDNYTQYVIILTTNNWQEDDLNISIDGKIIDPELSFCGTLTSNNVYSMTANATTGGAASCFTFSLNNITLNCNGHIISGGSTYQIYAASSADIYNISINDCVVNTGYPIYISGLTSTLGSITINRTNATGSNGGAAHDGYTGVQILSSSASIILDNVRAVGGTGYPEMSASHKGGSGIYVSSSSNVQIFNSYGKNGGVGDADGTVSAALYLSSAHDSNVTNFVAEKVGYCPTVIEENTYNTKMTNANITFFNEERIMCFSTRLTYPGYDETYYTRKESGLYMYNSYNNYFQNVNVTPSGYLVSTNLGGRGVYMNNSYNNTWVNSIIQGGGGYNLYGGQEGGDGLLIAQTLMPLTNNTFTNTAFTGGIGGYNQSNPNGVGISLTAGNNTFSACTNDINKGWAMTGGNKSFYSTVNQSTSSAGNTGWWATKTEAGYLITTTAKQAYYNVTTGKDYLWNTVAGNTYWYNGQIYTPPPLSISASIITPSPTALTTDILKGSAIATGTGSINGSGSAWYRNGALVQICAPLVLYTSGVSTNLCNYSGTQNVNDNISFEAQAYNGTNATPLNSSITTITVPPSEWYDMNFKKRKQINVTQASVYGDNYNFTSLLSLTDSDLGASAKSNGCDIIFTDYNNSQVYSFETEFYNSTKQIFWIKFPWLSNGSSTSAVVSRKFYMYFNSSSCTANTSSTAWDSSYKAVYHFNETSGTQFNSINSATHPLTCSALSAQGSKTTGLIGGANTYSGGSTSYCYADDSADFESSTMTVEALSIPDALAAGEHGIVSKYYDGSTTSWSLQAGSGASINMYSDSTHGTSGITISTGNLYYIAGTVNANSGAQLFISGTTTTGTSISPPANSAVFTIARVAHTSADRMWTGKIDEVRYSNVVRSSGYLTTTYNNLIYNTAFYTLGTYENQTVPAAIISIQTSRISPSPSAYANDTLLGYCKANSSDSSNVSYSYRWFKNNVLNLSGTATNYTSNTEINVKNITSGNLSVGDTWILECQGLIATDYSINTTRLNSSTTTILNSVPVVVSVTPPSAQDPQSCTAINVPGIIFNVTDNDGYIDISLAGSYVNISKGAVVKTSSTCIENSHGTLWRELNCTGMQLNYTDLPGTWTISAFAIDGSSASATNNTQTLTYNTGIFMVANNAPITFGTVTANTTNNVNTNSPGVNLQNCGNSALTLTFTGANITSSGDASIAATQFRIDDDATPSQGVETGNNELTLNVSAQSYNKQGGFAIADTFLIWSFLNVPIAQPKVTYNVGTWTITASGA